MQPADRDRGRGPRSSVRRQVATLLCAAAAAAVLCVGLGGCATTDEGDMPWNAPQSWEGSPYLPGLSDRY